MGSIPVGDSDFFFVPRSWQTEHSIFLKTSIFVHHGTPLVNWRRKYLEPKRKVLLKIPCRQSVIHMQNSKQICFVTNLGYEDLKETATWN